MIDEHILVIQRSHFFAETHAPWHGLKEVNFDDYIDIINQKKEFHPRALMEINPLYKQIIPYLIFTYDNHYFLMQRKSNASETRLRNKFTLGIGGHIRQEDMQHNSLIEWAMREFHEEVDYKGNLTIKPLGIINDDSDDVGKVHIGFAFLLMGNTSLISVKSELQQGELVSLDQCKARHDDMETWSKFVINVL